MRKVLMVIPIMTLLANIAILLDIPILREITVFIFLSFIPGFAILRLFKLKENSFLSTILFSAALSIAFIMFMGLLVNELYLFLGFSQPLSAVPLTVAISAFTLAVSFVDYRRDLSETLSPKTSFESELKNIFPLSIILFLLPLLSVLGVLYLNIPVILLADAIIAALCVLSAVSRRLVPENLFPLLIFSISIALVCQVLLTSKYIVGYDANLEYYVFRLTQINGHWGLLNANVNSLVTLTYDSMLSISLLPAAYSALMGAQGDIVFKILYPFIFCLIPLTLYQLYGKSLGKLIGLFSTLFFVFTSVAFFGATPLSLNREIVGGLFLLLSVYLIISKTIPVTKRRLLLIIFGAALIVSHYSLAYIFLAIVAVVFIISKVKPGFDDTLNAATVLLLFGITFSLYTLTNWPLISLIYTINGLFVNLTVGLAPIMGSAASTTLALPQVFTVATWINLLLSGIAYLFLITGFLAITLRPRRTGISGQYRLMIIIAAIILVGAVVVPSIASPLGFPRVYAIALLFLSPCFVLGGQALLATIGKALTKIKRPKKRQIASKSKNVDVVLLLIAIILCGYFLSQVGFVNRVTGGAIGFTVIDFDRVKTSSDPKVIVNFYSAYIPEQDVSSAVWLLHHEGLPSTIYADSVSGYDVLTSYGLTPRNFISHITNLTIPYPASFVYLSRLNVADSIITTSGGAFSPRSEILPNLNGSDLVYSNGNGEIWHAPFQG